MRWCATYVLLFMVPAAAGAQEVDCAVQVTYDAIANTHGDLLRDFQRDISDYVNAYRWGQESPGDKIKCTITINITSAVGENRYSAQVFIGSQRPIYGTQRSTATVRLIDDGWEFTYVQSRPIIHNEYSFNDLTTFLDFYIYLILGYDYDTYEAKGGTPFFQRAADLASIAKSSGQKGWRAAAGSYSRPQLIEEILSPSIALFRVASFHYHFNGLDSLAINPAVAHRNILHALEMMGKARRATNPRNLYIKAWFETKYLELAEVFSTYPDPSVYNKLTAIDPAHQSTYEDHYSRRTR